RFEMLEETLRITHELWRGEQGSEAAFRGQHYQAERLLNSPQALSRPHPPILVGGGGERKTLRLVAQYADATNVFGGPDALRHKYQVLRAHCEAIGRDYATIEKTNLTSADISADGHGRSVGTAELVDRLGDWAEAGSQHTIVGVERVDDIAKLELIGREVIPHIRGLGEPSPIRSLQPLAVPA
nr:LLM class flavin-dependent oxidoreductase [Chloroflexota bacterium]